MRSLDDPPPVFYVRLKPGTGMADSVVAATDNMINEYEAVFECPGGKKYTQLKDGTYKVIAFSPSTVARVLAILKHDFVIVREE